MAEMQYSENYDNYQTVRILPNDIEAEQAILGCMFFGEDTIAEVHEILTAEDFYGPDNRIIYETFISLYSKGIPADIVTVKNMLDDNQLIEQVGGMNYLLMLAGSVSTAANVRYYINIVEKRSIQRKLIQASNSIAKDSYDSANDVKDLLERAEKSIFDISQRKRGSDFASVSEILTDVVNAIETVFKNKGQISGIPTGFTDLDLKMTGLHPSDLVLIAARPAMGKTAFALNIAHHVAVQKNMPTAIFSLEMSRHQIVNRLLCAHIALDSQKLRTGDLNANDWEKIVGAIGPLSDAPLYIDDTPGITPTELRAKCRKLKMRHGLKLIIIDYLQLMSGSTRNESRQQEISEISRTLKALAREMEAPVVALSQLSRAVESRGDKRPMLSDLRESGAIEQDADVVTFIYRDEYYNPDSDKKGQAEIIIAKQRNGPTGTVNLSYMGKYTKFGDLEWRSFP